MGLENKAQTNVSTQENGINPDYCPDLRIVRGKTGFYYCAKRERELEESDKEKLSPQMRRGMVIIHRGIVTQCCLGEHYSCDDFL